MNFNFSRFFQHTSDVVLSLFLLTLGSLFTGLAWSALIRTEAITFILERRWTIFSIGVILLLAGILLIAYVMKNSKRRYTYIIAGKNACVLDEKFIQQYLELYWENSFPSRDIVYDLNIKKNKIQIFANFPPLPLEEQKRFLEKQKRELSNIFGRLLGYPHDIILAASFKEMPSSPEK